MNLNKSYDFFQPEMCRERIHIIGCGAIGSTVAENLVRFGLTKISLYDFDTVEPHNIANQMFRQIDIGKSKVSALSEILCEINPDVKKGLKLYEKGYTGQNLSGYVFLCVDSIELRKEIAEANKTNPFIKGMFDFRMRLTDAQHFAADWKNQKLVTNFLNTMCFTDEEAKSTTPVSACNMTLSVATTVRMIVASGVSNFINFVKGDGIKKQILIDSFGHMIEAF